MNILNYFKLMITNIDGRERERDTLYQQLLYKYVKFITIKS